ncbi:MAG TPA: protease HtpX [Spirochaetota bacterium]|jgi:heat shock protein HtpX|nr:protease HtpX [Spirochaetota bacterium]OPZ37377.1 MAG: Protease HtpX [Spirochaetes bacterium ADurb.BinA120]HPI13389.1 protease HtpX [Spirochaetota bacterium]HPO45031.1 protease HtpX [Spirochaetota bacterium]HPV98604.1 protease HtpX [Spirochaetota bacterium]
MFKRIGLFLLVNILVVVALGIIMNIVLPLLGVQPTGDMLGLAIFCGIFGMSGAFISLAISRWMAKRAYNIQLIDGKTSDPGAREIYDMVARLSRKAGLPGVPEVGIYQAPQPNAFATGPSKKKSLVAFSTGLLSAMDRQEVEAVAAHEISHIANGDMVTMTLLTGVMNAFVMFLSRIIAQLLDSFLRDDEGRGGLGFLGYMLTVMVLETFLMLLASIPLAAFSRRREYRADAGAAKYTSAMSMINALKRLAEAAGMPEKKDSFSMAKINSGKRASLFATHPSIEDRIARLMGK